jgi:negative regulator of flagellin synthesis FlgM
VKINGSIPLVTPNDGAARTKPAVQGSRRTGSASTDQVDLSDLSARIQDAGSVAAESSPIDTAKVAEIKQAISEGRFQINPERIADGLLENVRQMLARQQG